MSHLSVSPEIPLLDEYERRIADLTIDKQREIHNLMVGGLATAMESMPGGPEAFLKVLDRAETGR